MGAIAHARQMRRAKREQKRLRTCLVGNPRHRTQGGVIALHKRIIGLDVHQAQITACAIIEEADGTARTGRMGGSATTHQVVMESTGI